MRHHLMRPQYLHQRRLRQFAQNEVNVARSSAAADWDELRTASESSGKKGIKEEECVPQSEGGRVVGGRIEDQLQRNRGFSASSSSSSNSCLCPKFPRLSVSSYPSFHGSFVHSSGPLRRIRPWLRPVIRPCAQHTGVISIVKSL